jgi:hydrogenase nickel incorporation protein HypA/HybF
MHEFSLASEVINLVQREAEKRDALCVNGITIEVGSLSGVEADAFESALKLLSEDSILAKADINIRKVNGKGLCMTCPLEFEMKQRMDSCPVCHSFPSEINGGDEFRVISMSIEERC